VLHVLLAALSKVAAGILLVVAFIACATLLLGSVAFDVPVPLKLYAVYFAGPAALLVLAILNDALMPRAIVWLLRRIHAR
jgi:hypothetical protein